MPTLLRFPFDKNVACIDRKPSGILFLTENVLIRENGPTNTLTGQTYLQKALNSHIKAMNVGTSRSISTDSPETLGLATRVVEKVARIIKTISLSQLLVNHTGHTRERPKNRFWYLVASPFKGVKKDPRCIRSPNKGRGHIVHQDLPVKGVSMATRRKSQIAHIVAHPGFCPTFAYQIRRSGSQCESSSMAKIIRIN